MDWVSEVERVTKVSEGNNKGIVKWEITAIPQSYEEVRNIIKIANERKLSIYPYSLNSHHIGPPISVNIGLNLSNLNKIIEISDEDFYVTAQVGIKINELFNILKNKGLFLPAYYNGSLGGFLSTNFPTPFSSFYGYPKNLILMAKIITGDGIIVRSGGKTTKFSSGYKLHKLLSGMLGWLGIYLEATLKAYPYPEVIVTAEAKNINLTSKYRPVSLIYEREKEEKVIATFLGFKNAIEKMERELGIKTVNGFYTIDYSEGENVVSLHITRGREIEEVKKAYEYLSIRKTFCIIGTGYCRLVLNSFEGLEKLRSSINGYVVIEKGEYSGDYWGFRSKTLHRLKNALDPNAILCPGLYIT